MKIITLMENTALPGFQAEHGLSFYLETGGMRILFDMGQSGAFAENAKLLGVDLSQVDMAVISHGHYDHGGGLEAFLRCNSHAPVYVSRYALEEHYNREGKDIGLDSRWKDHPRLRFVKRDLSLSPGLKLCTLDGPPADNGGMRFGEDRKLENFRHEQYLLVREGEKTILLSGCSHKGIVRIAEHFRPDILVGGFHLMKVENRERLAQTAGALQALPTRYATGHCTGQSQFAVLKNILKDRLEYWPAGTAKEI